VAGDEGEERGIGNKSILKREKLADLAWKKERSSIASPADQDKTGPVFAF